MRDLRHEELAECPGIIWLPIEAKAIPQLERIEGAASHGAALQELVLRLVVVVGVLFLLVRFLERDHVRGFLLDQDLDARLVDGRLGERAHANRHDDEQECRQRQPSTLVEHLEVDREGHSITAENIVPVSVVAVVAVVPVARVPVARVRCRLRLMRRRGAPGVTGPRGARWLPHNARHLVHGPQLV